MLKKSMWILIGKILLSNISNDKKILKFLNKWVPLKQTYKMVIKIQINWVIKNLGKMKLNFIQHNHQILKIIILLIMNSLPTKKIKNLILMLRIGHNLVRNLKIHKQMRIYYHFKILTAPKLIKMLIIILINPMIKKTISKNLFHKC
jgi:hypothetical protein